MSHLYNMLFSEMNTRTLRGILFRSNILTNFLNNFFFPDTKMERKFIDALITRGGLTINEILLKLFETKKYELMDWLLIEPSDVVKKAKWTINQEVINNFAKNSEYKPAFVNGCFTKDPFIYLYLSNYLITCYNQSRNIEIINVVIYNESNVEREINFWLDAINFLSEFKIKIDHNNGNSLLDAIIKLDHNLFVKFYNRIINEAGRPELVNDINKLFLKKANLNEEKRKYIEMFNWSVVKNAMRLPKPISIKTRNALKNLTSSEIPDNDFPNDVLSFNYINIPLFIRVAHIKGYNNIYIAYLLRNICNYPLLLRPHLNIGDGFDGTELEEEAFQEILDLFNLNDSIETRGWDNFLFLVHYLDKDIIAEIMELIGKYLTKNPKLEIILDIKERFGLTRNQFNVEIGGINLMKFIDEME